MKEKRAKRRKLPLCCCCGRSRRDTVPSTLQWERLPEQQQRTQEEPAPCELGLSAPHGQEKAAQTHTFKHRHTHTQRCTPEQLLPQQSPLCSFNRDGLPALQQQEARREADTQKVTQQTNILREPGCDWHRFNGCNMKTHICADEEGVCGFNKRKWALYDMLFFSA